MVHIFIQFFLHKWPDFGCLITIGVLSGQSKNPSHGDGDQNQVTNFNGPKFFFFLHK